MQALLAHLADDGVLFLGHAEGSNIHQFGFANLAYPMSFVFARKKYAKQINDALNATHSEPPHFQPATVNAPFKETVKGRVPNSGSGNGDKKRSENTPLSNPDGEMQTATKARRIDLDLLTAKQLAEQQRFAEVTALCEKLLSEGVEFAEIYYLMGQAAASTGDSLLAEEYLSKAIYLNADYHDALIDLSKLFRQMGNTEKAASFRRRAQRVKSRKERNAQQ